MNQPQAAPKQADKKPGRKVSLTELVLRDGHQSLLATRMRLEDMLPIAAKMDKVGFWSVESWGGATFDACIRFLGEDPWERIRALSGAMPNTPQQMLLRGQNILGYRHYADDVVYKFVELARKNGVRVFRVFDALNDLRNLKTAIRAVIDNGGHAQGTLSYTLSPVHTLDTWLDLVKRLADLRVDSLAIKDMSGLLTPYTAYRLVKRIKQMTDLRVHIHCHATTGLSTATAVKAVEAGADTIDTSISSMSMTYGHSATESLVTILRDSSYDTGLDMDLLQDIAAHFRVVRKKYARFEGSLKGVDARILKAQVPGGMLTNMENQLREQNADDKLDKVLAEIPRVRKDLGYVPLVTPSSQIVGTQAVLNVLSGERYKNIAKETAALVKGEYGRTPAPVSAELQQKVGRGPGAYDPGNRPAELKKLGSALKEEARKKQLTVAEEEIEDVLTYALFPQVALKFFANRNNPAAFEPVPGAEEAKNEVKPTKEAISDAATYAVSVEGKEYQVQVRRAGAPTNGAKQAQTQAQTQDLASAPVEAKQAAPSARAPDGSIKTQTAPLAGNIFRVLVQVGDVVQEGQALFILEAMKMETEVCAIVSGRVATITARQGDKVAVGDPLIDINPT